MTSNKYYDFAKEIYENNISKGFYDEPRSITRVLNLIRSEAMEAFELLRKNPDQVSEKIPPYLHFDEEIADILIRLFDTTFHMFNNRYWPIEEAIIGLKHSVDIGELNLENEDDKLNLICVMIDRCANGNALKPETYTYAVEGLIFVIALILFLYPNVMEVSLAKHKFNKTRPYKHGKKF